MIRFEIPQFSPEDNFNFSEQVNKHRNACGCDTGAVFLFIATGIAILYLFTGYPAFHLLFITKLLYCAGFVLIFSLIGKLTGLIIARVQLYKVIKKVQQLLHQHDTGKEQPGENKNSGIHTGVEWIN